DDPSEFYAMNLRGLFDPTINDSVRLTSKRVKWSDPPQGGGYTFNDPPDNSYPFFYDPTNGQLPAHHSGDGRTLYFHDAPADGCLIGGSDADKPPCDNTHEPPGSYLGFTTHLAGIKADGTAFDLKIGFDWTTTWNGTSNGRHVLHTDYKA